MTDPHPSGQGVVGPRGGLEKYKDTPNLRVIGERQLASDDSDVLEIKPSGVVVRVLVKACPFETRFRPFHSQTIAGRGSLQNNAAPYLGKCLPSALGTGNLPLILCLPQAQTRAWDRGVGNRHGCGLTSQVQQFSLVSIHLEPCIFVKKWGCLVFASIGMLCIFALCIHVHLCVCSIERHRPRSG